MTTLVANMDDSILDISCCSELSLCFSEPDDQPQSINVDLSNGSPLGNDTLVVAHWNINSILAEGRLEELTENVNALKAKIVVLSETKLNETIPNNLIEIPGFHEPIRRDRNLHGGGCLIYISQIFTYKQQKHLQSNYFENISVDVRINGDIYSINCYYRPPNVDNHNLFLEETEKILDNLNAHNAKTKLILSDLNFGNCYSKSPLLTPKPLDDLAPEVFALHNFHQLIDIPTRVATVKINNINHTTTSLIDLIFTDNLDNLSCHGTVPCIADHYGIFAGFNCKIPKPKVITKRVHDYKNVDETSLREYIKNVDFENLVFSKPVKEQADEITKILQLAVEKFVPTKLIIIKPNDQPWLNSYTRLLLRKKNRNYSIFTKTNASYLKSLNNPTVTQENVTRLKAKRDKADTKSKSSNIESKKANLRAKNAFFNTVNATMQNYEISAKKKFSILLKLMRSQKLSSIPPILSNNEVIDDAQRKSQIFNDIFTAKATVAGDDDPVPDLDPIDSIFETLSGFSTSPIEVSKILRELKRSNSSHCGIPGKFINMIATPISFSLSRVFNNCFEIGHFPDIFKISHVTALWKKKGLKSEPENYRPIALLPTLSKAAESIIHKRFLNHCQVNNIISDRQAAYLKGDSTIHQLLYIVDLIRKSWTKGDITQGIFLDVSAAFDKCWHKGLIAKLKQAKVEGLGLNLFESYLENRKQCTVVDGMKSTFEFVTAGVPQGSKLGPLLWLIYCNDIVKDIDSEIFLFADDTCLFVSGNNPAETAAILNKDLETINEWAKAWKVTFNPGKSKDIIFSPSKVPLLGPSVLLDGAIVERVLEHKHLGIYLSSNLSWARQIHEVCLQANRKLAVLRSVKYLKRSTLDLLYKICVRSTLEYGLIIYYHNLTQLQQSRLSQIQYRAAKLCSGALHFTSQSKLETDLAWESISDRAKFLGLCVFNKIDSYQTRPLIRDCMPPKNTGNTRANGTYIKQKFKSVNFSKSFFPLYSELWSKLDKNIREEPDLTEFKSKLKATFKPKRHKHFNFGTKYGNSLLCRLRLGRSFLRSHGFAINLSETDRCLCGISESSTHYLLDCAQFDEQRRYLFDSLSRILPNFETKSKSNKAKILLNGINLDNDDPDRRNKQISLSVQNYILNTGRFSEKYAALEERARQQLLPQP